VKVAKIVCTGNVSLAEKKDGAVIDGTIFVRNIDLQVNVLSAAFERLSCKIANPHARPS